MERDNEHYLKFVKDETRLRYHDYALHQDRWNCVVAGLVFAFGIAILYALVGVLLPKLLHR